MKQSRSFTKAVTLALAAAVALAAAPGASAQATNLSQASRKTLLVFPFDVTGGNVPGPADVSVLLTDVARSRLIASDMYTVIAFYKSLAPVARLHNDQKLSDADIAGPFAEDNVKAVKIAKEVGYDMVFVGSLDDYQYNETEKEATVTISARLINVADGKILRSATLSAPSTKGGVEKEPEEALQAARAASDKLMAQMVPASSIVRPVTPTPPMKRTQAQAPGRRRNNTGILLGLLAVAIGLGIGLSSGGGGGGGTDGPPAPPN